MPSPKTYPTFLEAHWLARARLVAPAEDDDAVLEKLRPAVQALSDLFTTERPKGGFPDYAANPAKRVAYGLFFFPQSFVKCAVALDPLLTYRGWRPAAGEGPVRILDLGSASGPCGLAAALRLARETGRKVVLTAFDHSSEALAALAHLASTVPEIAAHIIVETKTGDLRRAAETLAALPPQDLVTVGFAANEIFGGLDDAGRLAWVEGLGELLAGDGLLLILEPALKETAAPLRRLRDATLSGPKLYPWGPDIAPTPCPMLAAGGKFWDHEVREWDAPASLKFLNRKLHRDTRVLKFAQAAFGRKPAPPAPGPAHTFRIVSPFEMNKGGFAFTAVTREGVSVKIDIPNRGLTKHDCKRVVAEWERGDIGGCDAWTPLGSPGTYRISTLPDLQRLYSPGIFPGETHLK